MSVKIRPNWNFASQEEANQLLLQLSLENRAYLEAILHNLAYLTAKQTDAEMDTVLQALWQQVGETGGRKFEELRKDYHGTADQQTAPDDAQ
jgi:hypothetical protein